MTFEKQKSNKKFGIPLVLLAGVFWSTSGIVYRLIDEATAWQVLYYRSFALFIMMITWLIIKYKTNIFKLFTNSIKLHLIGGFFLGTAFTGYIQALEYTSVANAMFILAIAPFITALIGIVILKEKILVYMWICMIFTAIGLTIMIGEEISLGSGLGEFSAMIAALGFSGMTITIRANNKNDLLPTILIGSFFALVFSGGMIIFKGDNFSLKNIDLIYSCGMGVFQLGLGVVLYTAGARHLISVELTLLSLTEVIVGPILVWIIIDESPTKMGLLGGLIILFSIVVMAIIGIKSEKKY